MEQHAIVSRDEWTKARIALLAQEKELTRARDKVAAERLAMPWVKVEKDYTFDTLRGPKSLGDLFDGRSQLIVKHFMMWPGRNDVCTGCAFEVDHVGGTLLHLNNHDVTYVAVARAPMSEIEPVRRRMGWEINWVSSFDSDFNYDFHVSFKPDEMEDGTALYNYQRGKKSMTDLSGHSCFYRNEAGEIFHTYSAYGRGAEEVLTTYMYLDMAPLGRNEGSAKMSGWVRPHDKYAEGGTVDGMGQYHAPDKCCG
tara:strand:- start:875 stop:1633 length:759 start_codon:yes stop_codon:yes gene_type:complete